MSLREALAGTVEKRPGVRPRPPIDFDHLRQQTLGKVDLQKQVLRLFLRQVSECIEKIRSAPGIAERSQAAHTLVGAARGVGAFSVAYIASEIELAKGPITGRLIAVERAVEAVRVFVADFLAE